VASGFVLVDSGVDGVDALFDPAETAS
jgi:hypothetical protein